jgi:hypothetical protein
MNKHRRKAIFLAVLGLILIVIGLKSLPVLLSFASQQAGMSEKPVILFFNEDEPCECMVELTERADQQIANWPVEQRGSIPIVRIGMRQRQDLEAKYKVFRAPCLVLVDDRDQVAWRQDYPLIEGGPFELDELEAAIAELKIKK